MVTVVDVARHAGVSPATVSRVLNGRSTVQSDARDRVLAAARELDYQPNRLAQGLRRGRGHSVALLVGDIEQNIYSALTKHVQAALGEVGLDLMLYNLDHSPARLRAILEQAPAMGLRGIALATTDRLRLVEIRPLLQGLIERGLVVLSVGQRLDRIGVPSIVHEERAATRRSVGWLIEQGHTPVAYVGRLAGSTIGTERYRGYADAVTSAGLPLRRELILDVSYRYAAGYDAIARLIGSGVAFRAVQAGSDEIALGMTAAIRDRGLSLPQDIAVIGFGDIDWGRHVRPALTTISVDHRLVGQAVAAALQDANAGRSVAPLLVLPRRLIQRETA